MMIFSSSGRDKSLLDDYPYAGIDFRGDPDMSLPPGVAYGAIGKTFLDISFIFIFIFCIFVFKEQKYF
jgi:hypothetical protein